MSLRQLKLSDLQVNSCGRWTAPNGTVFIELPHTLAVYTTLAANAPIVTDYEQATPPEFSFFAKAISNTGLTPGTLVQVQWPDGKYLSNVPVDAFSFWGTGKRARWLEIGKLCPPSSKIRLTFDNSAVDAESDVEMFFEGVLRIPMVNG